MKLIDSFEIFNVSNALRGTVAFKRSFIISVLRSFFVSDCKYLQISLMYAYEFLYIISSKEELQSL